MTACGFPGCVALAVEGDPAQRCAVHRQPGADARPCADCRGTGWLHIGHPCERCGGTGYGPQKRGTPKGVGDA